MRKGLTDEQLGTRYGELYKAVCALPAKKSVDSDRILSDTLRYYILDLQLAIVNNPAWELEQVQRHVNMKHPHSDKIFSLQGLKREKSGAFSIVVLIREVLAQKRRMVTITDQTNAGTGNFNIIDAEAS